MKVYMITHAYAYEGRDVMWVYLNKEDAVKRLEQYIKEENFDHYVKQSDDTYVTDSGDDISIVEHEIL